MSEPPKPRNEAARMAALESLNLLDTAPEERFDHVTRLAQRLFNVPIALVTLVDGDRVWLKSRQGIEGAGSEGTREASFCGHAILSHEIMTVPDATNDDRFDDNPFVLGDPNIRFYAGCPIAGPTGHLLGTLCIIDSKTREMSALEKSNLRDLADIVENEMASQHLATLDTLTGLTNRRGFEMLAEKLLATCCRRKVPATLLYFDLDGFKTVNDRFGHARGDDALREFASLLEVVLRDSDIVARIGGDEFVALLGETEKVDVVLKRIDHVLDDRNRKTTEPFQLEVSVGTAVFDPSGTDSLDGLMGRADTAMYSAKRAENPTDPLPGDSSRH